MKSLEGKDGTCMMVNQNRARIMGRMRMVSDSANTSAWRCVSACGDTQKH